MALAPPPDVHSSHKQVICEQCFRLNLTGDGDSLKAWVPGANARSSAATDPLHGVFCFPIRIFGRWFESEVELDHNPRFFY